MHREAVQNETPQSNAKQSKMFLPEQTNNNQKTEGINKMIKCAYCEYEARRNSGMAMHLRSVHPDNWKGSLNGSWPEGYNPGEQEPMIRHKTKRGKGPAPTKCPFCGHNSRRAQGLAAHLKSNHPDKWKGNMGDTLGLGPSRQWRKYDKKRKSTRSQKWLQTRKSNLQAVESNSHEARGFINHCPACGTNLVPFYLAKGIADRQ